MNPRLFPRLATMMMLGMFSPLALAAPKHSSHAPRNAKAQFASTPVASQFYLPAPVSSKASENNGKSAFQARTFQRKGNASRLTPYRVDPLSLANGIVAASKAYQKLHAR